MDQSPGEQFRHALSEETPLQIVGVVNALCALIAKDVGFKAIYLSGAGVSNVSYGLPDLGMTTLDNVLNDVRRITDICDLPLLVDIDTGWGSYLMIRRAVKSMIRAKAAAIHIEDQIFQKRCGHREGKKIVSIKEMVDRIKACVDARTDSKLIIMARTDALAIEGISGAVDRANAYQEAGANMLFLEAATNLDAYQKIKKSTDLPLLANCTEFGKTPLFTAKEFKDAGVDMILYPLSASRAMHQSASKIFQEIRTNGTQNNCLDQMQTREELYRLLNYETYEKAQNSEMEKST